MDEQEGKRSRWLGRRRSRRVRASRSFPYRGAGLHCVLNGKKESVAGDQ